MTVSIPTLETARLRLRPYRMDDATAYARHILTDPDVMRYMNVEGKVVSLPRLHAEELIKRRIAHWERLGFGAWVLERPSDSAFMGHAGLFTIDDTDVIEIGYALAKPFWGKGYATEAARRVLQFAFEETPLDHLVAVAFARNTASLHVLEKIGMQRRGLTSEYYGVELVAFDLSRDQYRTRS